jgi:hypothetical protein
MKCFITVEAKQDEATINRTMKALVNTPNDFGCGGEVGVAG